MVKNLAVRISLVFAAALLAISIPVTALANDNGVNVVVNGSPVTSPANTLMDGKVYVDVDAYAKQIGASYTLDPANKTATINGETILVRIIDGKPAAHVRAVAEATGADQIAWDQATLTTYINYLQSLVVYGDIVSDKGGCVLQNRFTPGDGIVFRMTAINPLTGEQAKDAQLKVHLSTGEVLDMHLGTHPPDAKEGISFWTAKYEVTDKTPKGILNYYVTADEGQKHGEYRPFNIPPSLITIVPSEQQ